MFPAIDLSKDMVSTLQNLLTFGVMNDIKMQEITSVLNAGNAKCPHSSH